MIELRNVTKVFNLTGNEEDRRTALDHVNLKINDGEFVTIIGSNGSGKSTSINIICGSLMPDDGRVILSGMDITDMKEYQRAKYFGRVFQDPMMGTTSEMSCLENLEIAYRRGISHSCFRWGFSNSVVKRYYRNLLEEFDLKLEDRLEQKVGVMSGGQRQALTLLMAAMDPKVYNKHQFVKMYLDINTGILRSKITEIRIETNKKIERYKRYQHMLNSLMKYTKEISDKNLYSTFLNKSTNVNKEIKSLKENSKIEINKIKSEIKELTTSKKQKAIDFFESKQKSYKQEVEAIKSKDLTEEEKEKLLLDEYLKFSDALHEYNQDRKILLLDEHTAALDPKTASKVLNLTNKIVRDKKLTTLMVTHNMRDALDYGDRLIMFHNGHVIHDFSKKEKENLSPSDLVKLFDEADKVIINN